MNQIATVTKVNGDGTAEIETSRKSMCDFCEKGANCSTGAGCSHDCEITGLMSRGKPMTARACNNAGAEVGDIVEVDTPSSTVLIYAAAVFVAPIVIGLALYLIFLSAVSQTAAYIASPLGFIATFIVIYLTMERRSRKKPDIKIVSVKFRRSALNAEKPE